MMRIDGGCFCGAIRYVAEIDPARIAICHCTDCQTLTGSPYRVSVFCSPEDIRVTSGEAKALRKTADSGRIRLQMFCGDCGTPLFATDEDPSQGRWSLRWGSITHRDQLKPTRQIWCRSAVPWIDELISMPGQERE